MEGSEFWEKTLLKPPVTNCIYHVLVPTVFSTKMASWDRIKNDLPKGGPELRVVQRRNLLCAICSTDVQQKQCVFCIRFLVTFNHATINGEPVFLYLCAINTAAACIACAKSHLPKEYVGIICDMRVVNAVCDLVEEISRNTCQNYFEKRVSGETFLKDVLKVFAERNECFLEQMGRLNGECAYCCKPNPKARCSGCHYYRYCSKKCQKAEWTNTHQHECAFLKKNGTLFMENHIIEAKK